MFPHNINEHPIHLGLGARAVAEPLFGGGMDWYAAYSARHASDGAEGRLVSMYKFTENWTVWEMHPSGHEVVLCTAGRIQLLQEVAGGVEVVTLGSGQYAIIEPGTWHTADVVHEANVVFITAGEGTEHRSR